MIEQVFWNYLNWNWGYAQLFMVWIFLRLFFTKKTAVQTARLHDLSAVQRPATTVQWTLGGAYLELWSINM